jgi:hypothetical protein
MVIEVSCQLLGSCQTSSPASKHVMLYTALVSALTDNALLQLK